MSRKRKIEARQLQRSLQTHRIQEYHRHDHKRHTHMTSDRHLDQLFRETRRNRNNNKNVPPPPEPPPSATPQPHESKNIFKLWERKLHHFFTSPAFRRDLNWFMLAATIALVTLSIAASFGAATGPAVAVLTVVTGLIQGGQGVAEIVQDPKGYQGYLDLAEGLFYVVSPVTEAAKTAEVAEEAEETAQVASREAVAGESLSNELSNKSLRKTVTNGIRKLMTKAVELSTKYGNHINVGIRSYTGIYTIYEVSQSVSTLKKDVKEGNWRDFSFTLASDVILVGEVGATVANRSELGDTLSSSSDLLGYDKQYWYSQSTSTNSSVSTNNYGDNFETPDVVPSTLSPFGLISKKSGVVNRIRQPIPSRSYISPKAEFIKRY